MSTEFFQNGFFRDFINNLRASGPRDVFDILIVAFAVYSVLSLVRKTRTGQLAKGALVLLVVFVVAGAFQLRTVTWILENVLQIGLLALILLLVLALWGLSFNHLMLSAVHPALADSRGVRVFWQEALFSAAIAVVVTVSMTWVGLLVINSLLVLPAAAARNISRNMFQYHLCSLLFAVGAGIAGLMTSYYIGSSAGASITLYLAGIFLVTFLLRKRG